MTWTMYANQGDEVLTQFALTRPDASDLEIELAQRLQLAVDKISDLENGNHARR